MACYLLAILVYNNQKFDKNMCSLQHRDPFTYFKVRVGCTRRFTVKRVDEVVRHLHLVTQDQNTQVSNKVFNIPEENFTINIELFRHFSQVSN